MTSGVGSGGYLARPAPSGLADVVDMILDKGLMIDLYARVSLVGIEILTIDARVAVASVDTYLRFAEATNRLDLGDASGTTLVELAGEGLGAAVEKVAHTVAAKKVDDALDTVGDKLGEPVEKLARKTGEKALDVAEKVATKLDPGD